MKEIQEMKLLWEKIYQYIEYSERTHYEESDEPKNHIIVLAANLNKLIKNL